MKTTSAGEKSPYAPNAFIRIDGTGKITLIIPPGVKFAILAACGRW